MGSTFNIVKEKLGKPYKDLDFLLTCLAEVLKESNKSEFIPFIPWINPSTTPPKDILTDGNFIHLVSMSFQLLNLVEVNGAVQSRRLKEEKDITLVNGLWASSFKTLKQKGFTEEEILEILPKVLIEPVLTAHPTEAKRTVVLREYRKLYLLLVKRENKMYTHIEQEENRDEIKHILHRLWNIDEIYIEKPGLDSELDNVLYYLTRVFPDVVSYVDKRLKLAWKASGFNPELLADSDAYPGISFGNWVGGDRDGHPLVTPELTRQTLNKLRINAFIILKKELLELAKKLSMYVTLDELDAPFAEHLKALASELDQSGKDLMQEHRNEIFKCYVLLLLYKLPIDVTQDHNISLLNKPLSYKHSAQLADDLSKLEQELTRLDYGEIAKIDVGSFKRKLNVFGFHIAQLDIRQNSQFHELALMQLIQESSGEKYSLNSQSEKGAFFDKELKINRPFLLDHSVLEDEAQNVIATLKVVKQHIENYSERSIGKLIVSMTRNVEDLLTVILFMREVGLTIKTEKGIAAKLPVVPLFETIDDMMHSPDIMEAFLSNPVVKSSLNYRAKVEHSEELYQDVMIGYSDSNKDGGILASAWFLYETQQKLTLVGHKHGVKIRFFHGKGGTISRGSGPVHWFIKTLPEGSINGKFRMTEQGESIERKYANLVNAAYNMELMMAGVATQSLLHTKKETASEDITPLFRELGELSRTYYHDLITDPDFIHFYAQATPIDVLEASKIGSRPSRRSGKRTMSDLRAIPWVFSWAQSRFNITGWYGVGSTLKYFQDEKPEQFEQLRSLVKHHPFVRYVLTNIDTSLASTDEDVMNSFAQLVDNVQVREKVMAKIITEFKLTVNMLAELLKQPMEARRTNHYYSTQLRADALKNLHNAQIELLKKWRKVEDTNDPNNSKNLFSLLQCVNAIANALGSTG